MPPEAPSMRHAGACSANEAAPQGCQASADHIILDGDTGMKSAQFLHPLTDCASMLPELPRHADCCNCQECDTVDAKSSCVERHHEF